MEPYTARAKVEGRRLLNDNHPAVLIRWEKQLSMCHMWCKCVPSNCVCVFTSHTQSDPRNLYYMAIAVLKEASGFVEKNWTVQAFQLSAVWLEYSMCPL